MPAVNFDLLYQAMAQAGGAWNQIVHWSRPFDWRGSITGSVDDAWQTALEDLGPAGVDKGNAGKCLILPPGYQGKVLDAYIPMPSNTYRSYAVQRSNLASGREDDIAKAVAYGKRVKLYPLAQAANPPQTIFIDAANLVYDNTIPVRPAFFSVARPLCADRAVAGRGRQVLSPS
jgi:hypothetical protein